MYKLLIAISTFSGLVKITDKFMFNELNYVICIRKSFSCSECAIVARTCGAKISGIPLVCSTFKFKAANSHTGRAVSTPKVYGAQAQRLWLEGPPNSLPYNLEKQELINYRFNIIPEPKFHVKTNKITTEKYLKKNNFRTR